MSTPNLDSRYSKPADVAAAIAAQATTDAGQYATQSSLSGKQSSTADWSSGMTGAVQRPLANKLSGFIDVKDFGAVGDGTTDDTASINAAFAAKKRILITPGTYKITAQLNVTGSGYQIIGAGRGSAKIIQYTDNTPILVLNGSRMQLESLSLTYANTQTSSNTSASAITVVNSASGGILSNSVIREMDITQCAYGLDLRSTIGYSCTFANIDVESFAISAFSTDSSSAWTQSKFDVWHIANQPVAYLTGTAAGTGSTTTIALASNASATTSDYVGMTIVLTGGSGVSGTVRFVTAYDGPTKTATFYPAASVSTDATTTYALARQATSSGTPFDLQGFTDCHIGEIAFEFVTLPTSVPAPISITSCQSVVIDSIRYERVAFRAANSALIAASGRTAVAVQGLQSEYCAALTALGVTTFYYARTYAQATIAFNGPFERNGWQITASAKWALASAGSSSDRTERPYGGVYFRSIPSGDVNISPSGQSYDYLGSKRQTAILERPSATMRGASLDEGAVATYNHSLMDSPDVVRFNTAITADVTFNLDQANLVSGAQVTVIRDTGCTGAFNINIKYGATTVSTLSTAGTSSKLVCHGTGFYVIP